MTRLLSDLLLVGAGQGAHVAGLLQLEQSDAIRCICSRTEGDLQDKVIISGGLSLGGPGRDPGAYRSSHRHARHLSRLGRQYGGWEHLVFWECLTVN